MGSRKRAPGGRRWERMLFSIMGPPQLGEAGAPPRDVPEPPVTACPTCREPYDRHEIVRSARLTYTRCPRT